MSNFWQKMPLCVSFWKIVYTWWRQGISGDLSRLGSSDTRILQCLWLLTTLSWVRIVSTNKSNYNVSVTFPHDVPFLQQYFLFFSPFLKLLLFILQHICRYSKNIWLKSNLIREWNIYDFSLCLHKREPLSCVFITFIFTGLQHTALHPPVLPTECTDISSTLLIFHD